MMEAESQVETQTTAIQKMLLKTAQEFPDKKKDEIISIVLDKMGMDNNKRPTVRRAKGQLIKKMDLFLEQMR